MMKKISFFVLLICNLSLVGCSTGSTEYYYSVGIKKEEIVVAQGICWSNKNKTEDGSFPVSVYVANMLYKDGKMVKNNIFTSIEISLLDKEVALLQSYNVDLDSYANIDNSIEKNTKEVLVKEDFNLEYKFDLNKYYPDEYNDPVIFEVLYTYLDSENNEEKYLSARFYLTYIHKPASDYCYLGSLEWYVSDGQDRKEETEPTENLLEGVIYERICC